MIPPSVLRDDTDGKHRIDALDVPTGTGKFEPRLRYVPVSALDFEVAPKI
jgi:hypothetical protein